MESFPVRLDKAPGPKVESSSKPEPTREQERTAKNPDQSAGLTTPAINNLKSSSVVFQVDDSGDIYIQVVDKETGQVVRQIPPEELRRLAETMTELTGQILNHSV
jgi:flagellar protein FlaG